jgi:hypothetical protein
VGWRGEDGLIKHHMARDEDPSGGKIKTPVPLVIRGVPEEDTESGAGVQLVRRSGSGVRVTRTPEDAKVIVPRRGTEKSVMWRRSGTSSGRKTVEEVGGGVQALNLETSRKRHEPFATIMDEGREEEGEWIEESIPGSGVVW